MFITIAQHMPHLTCSSAGLRSGHAGKAETHKHLAVSWPSKCASSDPESRTYRGECRDVSLLVAVVEL